MDADNAVASDRKGGIVVLTCSSKLEGVYYVVKQKAETKVVKSKKVDTISSSDDSSSNQKPPKVFISFVCVYYVFWKD